MTVSFSQMAYGFYERDKFPEEMEEEARVLRKDIEALLPRNPLDSLASSDLSPSEMEDEIIARVDADRKAERQAKGKMPKATPKEREAHERTIARKRARRQARKTVRSTAVCQAA